MKLKGAELLLLLLLLSKRRRAVVPAGEWEPQPDPNGFNVPVVPLPPNPLQVP